MFTIFFENYVQKILDETRFDTPAELARFMSVPRQRINGYKHTGIRPTARECLLVSQVLGVQFEEVFFITCFDKAKDEVDSAIYASYVNKYRSEINIPDQYKRPETNSQHENQ